MPTSIDRRIDQEDLSRAIDRLYEAFDRYPLVDRLDFCPHCELDDAERLLHVRPLPEMTWADLWAYCPRAVTTFGDDSDFRHFLPRILELYATDHKGAPCTLFTLFGKLDQAGWTAWPAGEVAAVRRFIDVWRRTLERQAPASEDAAWELDELRTSTTAL